MIDKTFYSIEELKDYLETISDKDIVSLTIETEGGESDGKNEDE